MNSDLRGFVEMEWPTGDQIKDIGKILSYIFGGGIFYELGRRIKNFIVYKARGIPRKTLILLPPKATIWCKASMNNEPAMQVMLDMAVTNFSEKPVCIAAAKLSTPSTPTVTPMVTLENARPNVHGQYEIPPDKTEMTRSVFFIKPPKKKWGKPFKARVCLTDQFNNEHWSKKITFTYH